MQLEDDPLALPILGFLIVRPQQGACMHGHMDFVEGPSLLASQKSREGFGCSTGLRRADKQTPTR